MTGSASFAGSSRELPESPATNDDRDLTREGYRPQFRRGLGAFAAFAAGFSYLSILTGIVQNFHLGYREAGPAFVWTWPAVFAGQLCLALCFAGLAREYPFCGGIYAWSRRSGSAFLGWLTGWVYLASLVVTLAAVALAWQVVLPAIWPGFHVADAPARNAALLGTVLIAISTALNAGPTRWLSAIMNVGVVVELVASVVLIVLLGMHAARGPGVTFETLSSDRIEGFGLAGPFLAAAVMAAYVMYGFDTAGTLAEETLEPRRRAPWAILQALAAAAFLGMLLLVFAVLAAPDPEDPRLNSDAGGLPFLIKNVLGDGLGKVFVGASVAAIFVCTLAVQANAARVLFAMARDRAVPGWSWLGRVHPQQRSPRAAAILIGVLGCVLLMVNMEFSNTMTALVCVSIVWANLAYLLTTGQMFVRSLRDRRAGRDALTAGAAGHTLHNRPTETSFLGAWTVPLSAAAVVWGIVLIVNVSWPREQLYGAEWYLRFGAPLYTGVLLLAGVVVYLMLRPSRENGEVTP